VEPLQIVPATPPVEATLRILMNSVPFLIGCAVVRQAAGPDAVAAEVGRNPGLFDRRLTTLQLPDDTLPANRAVALDWPVPYQAEWVGVPPRLLISRLVFGDRTVGVLLGTLITREPLNAQTREALDLSCELIASAMAKYFATTLAAPATAAPDAQPGGFEYAPPPAADPAQPRDDPASPATASDAPPVAPSVAAHIDEIAAQIGAAVAGAGDARAIGRILRDAMNEVSEASAFSVALFHADRPEVAYRYKVVGVDAASSELGNQAVDDSPSCFAIRHAERWHSFDRAVTVSGERRHVGVVQLHELLDDTPRAGLLELLSLPGVDLPVSRERVLDGPVLDQLFVAIHRLLVGCAAAHRPGAPQGGVHSAVPMLSGSLPDTVLFLEHPPTITLGRNARYDHLRQPREHGPIVSTR